MANIDVQSPKREKFGEILREHAADDEGRDETRDDSIDKKDADIDVKPLDKDLERNKVVGGVGSSAMEQGGI